MTKVAVCSVILLLLVSLPPPAAEAAETTVDLTLGGQGSMAWTAGRMLPGDVGSTTIELRNAGTVDANLMIWISNEEATDHGGDGAALAKYLRFSLSANGLRTSLALPAALDDLPDHPQGQGQLLIGPLAVGEAVTAIWSWEFLETGTTQNDAQGDGLSFNINYMLVDIPEGGGSYNFVLVDILGKESVVGTDLSGHVLEAVVATDRTGRYSLNIPVGTTITTPGGLVPSRITFAPGNSSTLPSGPSGSETLSVFDLNGYLNGNVVDVRLSPALEIVVAMEASQQGSTPLGLYQLNGGTWQRLPSMSETTVTWEVRSSVNRTGPLAIFAASSSGTVARLTVHDFQVTMDVTELWWPVVLMTNRGGSVTVDLVIVNEGNMSGSYDVAMMLDGEQVASEKVALEPGESKEIRFRATNLAEGTHEVSVAGEAKSFTTGTSVEWTTFIVLVVILLAVVLFFTRRRRPSKEIAPIVMADYQKRVLRELGEVNLSYQELQALTNIEDAHLRVVLEELKKEDKVIHIKERGSEMWALAGKRWDL